MKDRPHWIHDVDTFDESKVPDLHECLDLGSNIHSSGASGPSIRSIFAGNHFWVLSSKISALRDVRIFRHQHTMSRQVMACVSKRFGRDL